MKKELKKITRDRDDALNRLSATQHMDYPANYSELKIAIMVITKMICSFIICLFEDTFK